MNSTCFSFLAARANTLRCERCVGPRCSYYPERFTSPNVVGSCRDSGSSPSPSPHKDRDEPLSLQPSGLFSRLVHGPVTYPTSLTFLCAHEYTFAKFICHHRIVERFL